MKRRSFRLEQDLIDAVDAVRRRLGLNRTQYLRRALRSSIYGDASLLRGRRLSSALNSLLDKLIRLRPEKIGPVAGRKRLSIADQLKGVRAALQSDRTPVQLKTGLRKRAAELEKALEGKDG